jgi:hypothetical protein
VSWQDIFPEYTIRALEQYGNPSFKGAKLSRPDRAANWAGNCFEVSYHARNSMRAHFGEKKAYLERHEPGFCPDSVYE